MAEKREKRLVINTIILALGTFFPKVAVFITLPILTGRFTNAEYGTYDIILTLVSLLLPVATLQIQSSAFRFLIDNREDETNRKNIVSNIYAFIVPVSAVCLAVLFCVLYKYDIPLRLAIVAYFFFDTMTNATRQLVRGLGKNDYYTISAFISALGQVVLIFLFVVGLGMGLIGAVLALAISDALSFAFMVFAIKIYHYFDVRAVSRGQLKRMLAYSWPLVPNNLSSWVMRASDRFVILGVLGIEMNSIYAVAYKIPSILTFANSTFNMAWQESASMTVNSDDASRFYSSIFDKVYRLTVGMLGVLIACTPILFKILIRGSYEAAYPQIFVIYIAIFFSVLSAFWGGIYVAFKKSVNVGLTTVAAAAVNLIVNLSLIRYIGLYAASISTLVSYICLCLFRMLDSRKLIRIRYDFKMIAVSLAIVSAECVLSARRMIPFDIVNAVTGLALFCILNHELILAALRKGLKILHIQKAQ